MPILQNVLNTVRSRFSRAAPEISSSDLVAHWRKLGTRVGALAEEIQEENHRYTTLDTRAVLQGVDCTDANHLLKTPATLLGEGTMPSLEQGVMLGIQQWRAEHPADPAALPAKLGMILYDTAAQHGVAIIVESTGGNNFMLHYLDSAQSGPTEAQITLVQTQVKAALQTVLNAEPTLIIRTPDADQMYKQHDNHSCIPYAIANVSRVLNGEALDRAYTEAGTDRTKHQNFAKSLRETQANNLKRLFGSNTDRFNEYLAANQITNAAQLLNAIGSLIPQSKAEKEEAQKQAKLAAFNERDKETVEDFMDGCFKLVDKLINTFGPLGFLAMLLSMFLPAVGPFLIAMATLGPAASRAAGFSGAELPEPEFHLPAGTNQLGQLRPDAPAQANSREEVRAR